MSQSALLKIFYLSMNLNNPKLLHNLGFRRPEGPSVLKVIPFLAFGVWGEAPE